MTELTIVSGGLREPSSTRLLADRLAVSASKHLAGQGFSVTTRVVELPAAGPVDRRRDDDRLRQHRARGGLRDGRLGRRAGGGDAGVQRQLRRAVQVVLRRAARGVADRHARADRRDRRHRTPLARPRARTTAAVLLPPRDRLADRRLRRHRRLRPLSGVRRRAARSTSASTVPAPTSRGCSAPAASGSGAAAFDEEAARMERLLNP